MTSGPLTSRRYRRIVWSLVSQMAPTALQFLFLIACARSLKTDDFASLFLVVAISTIANSFVGLGAGGILMRDVSRDSKLAPIALGRALTWSIITTVVLLPTIFAVAHFVPTITLRGISLISIIVSDLLLARLAVTVWSLCIAREEHEKAAVLVCLIPTFRLLALLGLPFLYEDWTIAYFSIFYLAATIIALAIMLFIVRKQLVGIYLSARGYDYRAGVSFAATWLNASVQSEADKLVLGSLSSVENVALYTVASRLVDGAMMPYRALRIMIQPRMFRAGASGVGAAYTVMRKGLIPAIIYGVGVAALFWAVAPFGPIVFGVKFEGLGSLVTLLAFVPLIRGLQDLAAEVFQAADQPSVQAVTQSVASASRIALSIILVPLYGLTGIVIAAICVPAVTGTILWLRLHVASKRSPH